MPKRAYGKNRRQQRNRIEAELQQQLTKERSDAEANLAEQVDPTARWLLELERRVGQADYDDIEGWKTIIEELSVQFDDDDVSLATQAQLATLCTRPDINLHAILLYCTAVCIQSRNRVSLGAGLRRQLRLIPVSGK
jgi:hypothetical protein